MLTRSWRSRLSLRADLSRASVQRFTGISALPHRPAKTFTPFVNAALRQISSGKDRTGPSGNPLPDTNNAAVGQVSLDGQPDHGSGSTSKIIAASIEAIDHEFPKLARFPTKTIHLVLLLLSFYSGRQLYFPLCVRGIWRLPHWTDSGEIGRLSGQELGIAAELVEALPKSSVVIEALKSTEDLSFSTYHRHNIWRTDKSRTTRVINSLSPQLQSFWRHQAAIAACHSIPWKYLDIGFSEKIRKSLTGQIGYTLLALKEHGGFHGLAPHVRSELAVCLIEAARLYDNTWQQSVVAWVKELMDGQRDEYLDYRLAELECKLHRWKKDMDKAIQTVGEVRNIQETPSNPRANAALGLVILQEAENYIHTLDLKAAEEALESWRPLTDPPSNIEQTTLFENTIKLGRVLRFQGRFEKALLAFKDAKAIMNAYPMLSFNEDRSNLMRDIADTSLDTGNPAYAEDFIRHEMTLRQNEREGGIPNSHPLRLTLAESLFLQGRFEEARSIIENFECNPHMKFEKVRVTVLQAKLDHVTGDWEKAFYFWTCAIQDTQELSWSKSSHATRIILLSMCDAARQREGEALKMQPEAQFAALENLAGSSERTHWISGLYQWQKYLESPDRASFFTTPMQSRRDQSANMDET